MIGRYPFVTLETHEYSYSWVQILLFMVWFMSTHGTHGTHEYPDTHE